jgi:hypothetical protein
VWVGSDSILIKDSSCPGALISIDDSDDLVKIVLRNNMKNLSTIATLEGRVTYEPSPYRVGTMQLDRIVNSMAIPPK